MVSPTSRKEREKWGTQMRGHRSFVRESLALRATPLPQDDKAGAPLVLVLSVWDGHSCPSPLTLMLTLPLTSN